VPEWQIVTVKTETEVRWCVFRWSEPGGEWTGWGWRNEEGRWFYRWDDTHRKERL